MRHVIVGLFFIALGIWGVFDEWYYVVNCVKGGASVFLVLAGALALLTGLSRPRRRPDDAEADDAGQPQQAQE